MQATYVSTRFLPYRYKFYGLEFHFFKKLLEDRTNRYLRIALLA
jgi:hypothetical protein